MQTIFVEARRIFAADYAPGDRRFLRLTDLRMASKTGNLCMHFHGASPCVRISSPCPSRYVTYLTTAKRRKKILRPHAFRFTLAGA